MPMNLFFGTNLQTLNATYSWGSSSFYRLLNDSHMLALSFLPLASQNLSDAVDDGSGVGEEQRKIMQIRMICSLNVAFSQHNFICFMSEEMRSATITKKPKSSLFIPGLMPGLSTLMPFCLVPEVPEGICKTKVRQFCIYSLLPTSLPVLKSIVQ